MTTKTFKDLPLLTIFKVLKVGFTKSFYETNKVEAICLPSSSVQRTSALLQVALANPHLACDSDHLLRVFAFSGKKRKKLFPLHLLLLGCHLKVFELNESIEADMC